MQLYLQLSENVRIVVVLFRRETHVSIKWNNSRKRNNFPSTTIQIHVVCQELDLALYALVVSIFIAREIRIRAAHVQKYASFVSLRV